MLAHLARRGLAHPQATAWVKRAVRMEGPNSVELDVPVWGIVLVYVSIMIAAFGINLLSYMLNEVITTLCMVESPVAAITVSATAHEAGDKVEKEGLLETGPTITLVNQKPITSSIRGTIKHLVGHAGRTARFRGLRIYVLYGFLMSIVNAILSAVLPGIPGQPIIVAALTGAALANVHATWTHKVISMPSDMSFRQRFVPTSQWKTLAYPAAIEAAMPYISLYLVAAIGMLMGLHQLDREEISSYNCTQITGLVLRMITMVVLIFASALFLCVPAIVTLVRIEASILPEDQDTIVPFDRTFGGKVVSQMMGGSGKIAFLDAWRSFNWEARRRLIKLFIKSSLIMTGTIFIIVHILVAEVFVVMGPALGKFLSQAKAEGWIQ
ncbi:hypothetical protein GQ44DRAFT_736453 [Phaeosphaeriaceae sp. PMI808]|nr:hypothetical protein GQ44DRAFT_736453 [Phaeosphaeriaceae sp. PMI808]